MEADYLSEIINCIKEYYKVDDNAEITMETNPGTVSKEKLKRFKEAGFSRISIGIQSFDDEEIEPGVQAAIGLL